MWLVKFFLKMANSSDYLISVNYCHHQPYQTAKQEGLKYTDTTILEHQYTGK